MDAERGLFLLQRAEEGERGREEREEERGRREGISETGRLGKDLDSNVELSNIPSLPPSLPSLSSLSVAYHEFFCLV